MTFKIRTYVVKFTMAELQTLQLLIEGAAATASLEQVCELEAIDGKIYRRLFPDLVIERINANSSLRSHPMPLAHLRLVKSTEGNKA